MKFEKGDPVPLTAPQPLHLKYDSHFKANCCLKVYNVHLKLALPISGQIHLF